MEQYLAFLDSPIGLSSFLTCLDGKVSWSLFLDFLDGKPVTTTTAGGLPFLLSFLLLLLNPFFLSFFFFFFSSYFLESPLAIALKEPWPVFAASIPERFATITEITSLFLPYSNLITLPESLGLHFLSFFPFFPFLIFSPPV